MGTLKNYQSILDSYYNIPHQYMSLIDIFKHVVEHNTWNIIHSIQHWNITHSYNTGKFK